MSNDKSIKKLGGANMDIDLTSNDAFDVSIFLRG